MINSHDTNTENQGTSSFLFDNVNKLLSTFIPADHGRGRNQLLMSVKAKSHGTITFSDNKSNRAQFIRIPPDAPILEVKELLNRQWCNQRPSLVISVTGGAKDYNMKPKLLRAFRRGLLKVARTTGAWIITGGMNTGIMKLVGEIIQINPDRSRPIHLIGIATWGCVSGNQQLDVRGATVNYTKPRDIQKGEAPIEPNHTEFIFIDDGSEKKFGREIAFRAQLEQAISGDFFGSRPSTDHSPFPSLTEKQSLNPEQSDPIPVVLLVVEGGPNTVRTVHEAVVQNNIPAVLFEGTGRCCDLFAKAYRLYNEYRQRFDLTEDSPNMDPNIMAQRCEELKNKLRDELKKELREISGGGETPGSNAAGKPPRKNDAPTTDRPPRKNDAPKTDRPPRVADTTDYFELVYECIHTRFNFLNIVSLNSRSPVEPDIDLAIIYALLNATSGCDSSKPNSQRKREQFHLALEWNRVDVAKNYIMKDPQDWQKIDLDDMFLLALTRNQTEFVKLFLDNDFSLTDVFRNKDILPTLYMSSTSHHDFQSRSRNPLRAIYEQIIQPLIGDFFVVEAALHPQRYISRNQLDHDNNKDGCLCCRSSTVDLNEENNVDLERAQSFRSNASTGYTDYHFDVDKELFIWSVITGRRDFNLMFWVRGKNKICAALFAALIYRKRARKDNDNSYYRSADEFESLAVQILDKFQQANARACSKAIIRQIPAYGNVTWLELAVTAEAKEFIAQRAVQDVLNNIWFGYIDHRESHKAIIFSTIMIWYSGFLRFHNELVKTIEQSTFLDEVLQKSKIFQHNQTEEENHTKHRTSNAVKMRLLYGVSHDASTSIDFVDVGCCEKSRSKIAKYFKNILKFIRAPYVKYIYYLYFHVIFLLLFSYMLLCDFFPLYDYQSNQCIPAIHPLASKTEDNDVPVNNTLPYGFQIHKRASITEYLLAIWIFTLFCEETRQFFASEANTIHNRITVYFKEFWNILDFIAILLFYIGLLLHYTPLTNCFCAARIVLSVDLAMWFIRSLHIFAAVKQLGPKLVMIGEMAHDLKVYMLMLTVFILGFGVSTYSLVYGTTEFSWHLPREIINLAYWQIFGELNALGIFEHNYRANGYAVFILLIIYMAIVSILLVNLLIAMFSNTFDRLENDTDRIWKFQRYELICEYLTRPSLPPPFIFFSHLWRFILKVLTPCLKSSWLKSKLVQHNRRTQYKIFLDEKSATNIEIAEDALGDEVYYTYLKSGRKLIDEDDTDEERVHSPQEIIFNKIRALEGRMQIMHNQQSHVLEYLYALMDGLQLIGGDQIKSPERRRFDLDESCSIIYNLISEIDETNNTDPSKKSLRRESLIKETPRQSSAQSDDISQPTTGIHLSAPSRRV